MEGEAEVIVVVDAEGGDVGGGVDGAVEARGLGGAWAIGVAAPECAGDGEEVVFVLG